MRTCKQTTLFFISFFVVISSFLDIMDRFDEQISCNHDVCVIQAGVDPICFTELGRLLRASEYLGIFVDVASPRVRKVTRLNSHMFEFHRTDSVILLFELVQSISKYSQLPVYKILWRLARFNR